MDHKFFILENEETLNEHRWFLKDDVSKYAILLHDDIIINNPLFFKGFKSYKVSFNNPGEGLDYHGITIIPTTSLQDFKANVIKAREINVIPEQIFKGPDGDFKSKAIKIKPEIHTQLDELITLCEQAIDRKMYLIHFGL